MASGGWQYRSAYFMDFDGSYYLVTISAAKSNEGLMVYNIGQMKKEAFPKIKGSSATSDNGPRGNASNNSISTSDGNVNAKFSMKGMDSAYLAAVERGDTEAAQNAKTAAGEGSGVKYSLKNTSRGVAVVVDNDILNDIWNNYRGRLFCSAFGLFVGVMVLWLGFFQALFLMICIGIGFFIGYKLDMKEDLMEWLDRLLPPGYHR